MKKFIKPLIVLLSVAILLLGGVYWWYWVGLPVDGVNRTVKQFVVRKGEGVNQIGKNLKEVGLIKSDLYFKIYTYFKKDLRTKIQAGSFKLNTGMSLDQITSTLTRGTDDRWITVVEGLRQEEIGQLFVEEGFNIDIKQWNEKIRQLDLEGQLFPDTYLIPINTDIDRILGIFNKNFQKKVVVGLDNQITVSTKYSQKDFLTLASLVEREARSENSRLIVAGVIIKRLEAGWPLQIDATVQYAIGSSKCLPLITDSRSPMVECDWWQKSLGKSDLQINSPYNTYKNAGLPPGPICNPSISSIKAVLNPTQTDYWFYLTGNDNQMHYAKTIEEHSLNIQKYLY